MFDGHYATKHTEHQFYLLHNGFWIWSIFLWSIWFVQWWWRILSCLTVWPKWLLDKAIVQHAYWQTQDTIWIHLLNYRRTGGKLIWILTMSTPTQWRSVIHFGFRISLTSGGRKKKRAQSTPISPMCISIMNFSLGAPPEISKRMWNVNFDASIRGVYQTLGEHSG